MQNERTSRVSTNTLERSSRSPRSSPARSSTCPRSWGRNHLVARCLRPTKRNPCDMGYGQSWGAITYHAYQRVADETNVIVSNVLSPGPHGRTAAGPPVPAQTPIYQPAAARRTPIGPLHLDILLPPQIHLDIKKGSRLTYNRKNRDRQVLRGSVKTGVGAAL